MNNFPFRLRVIIMKVILENVKPRMLLALITLHKCTLFVNEIFRVTQKGKSVLYGYHFVHEIMVCVFYEKIAIYFY